MLVSTHLVEDVAMSCNDVTIMEAGRIVFRGAPMVLTGYGEGSESQGDSAIERGYGQILAGARESGKAVHR